MSVGEYFGLVRRDALALLDPVQGAAVLEVGCGTGNTLGLLKENGTAATSVGVELNADCADEIHPGVDELHVSPAEDFDFGEDRYDIILLLDVLEHLVEPYVVLDRAAKALQQDGQIIVSIPNVRNLGLLKRLIVNGRWDYADSGILDRGHLRFFTRKSFLGRLAAEVPGLIVAKETMNFETYPYIPQCMSRLPGLREFFACQLLFQLVKQRH